MRLFQAFFQNRPDSVDSRVPQLTLLASRLPRHDLQLAAQHLQAQPAQPEPVQLQLEQDWQTADFLLAELHFGAHTVQVAGFPTPLRPEPFQRSVETAAWGERFRAHLRSQQAHLVLQYAGVGTDVVQQYLALYRAAFAIAATAPPGHFLGVVNEPAWTSHPLEVLADLLDPELLSELPLSPPLPLWTGFVQADVEHPDGLRQRWHVTRGYHLFGIPDLAWDASTGTPAEAHERFADLFHYLYYENKDAQPGDFLFLDGHGYLAFDDGGHLAEALGGPANILTVRPSTEAEIEQVEADWAAKQALDLENQQLNSSLT